jgi:DNA-binding LacI/PurR family transcriptional regulator
VGKNRFAGYRHALKTHGIDELPELVFRGDYSFSTGEKGAKALLKLDEPPTAIMCANDSMALGTIKEASRQGLSVPKDLSIVGFDDITVAAQINPPLTTVAAPIDEIATLSVEMLYSMINGQSLEKQHVALPAHLQVRSTCAVLDSANTSCSE